MQVLVTRSSSTELRKIIILSRELHDWRVFLQWVERWVSADKQLSEVVERLRAIGHCHMLEVQLRLAQVEGDPSEIDFTKVLPGFMEEGHPGP